MPTPEPLVRGEPQRDRGQLARQDRMAVRGPQVQDWDTALSYFFSIANNARLWWVILPIFGGYSLLSHV